MYPLHDAYLRVLTCRQLSFLVTPWHDKSVVAAKIERLQKKILLISNPSTSTYR
jgi:hypothetical protein